MSDLVQRLWRLEATIRQLLDELATAHRKIAELEQKIRSLGL